jgi:hypothetical protein
MHISRTLHIYKIHKGIHIRYEAQFNNAKSDLQVTKRLTNLNMNQNLFIFQLIRDML